MFALTQSTRDLQAERAALWAQLDVETRAHACFPGLDLDEYREMRRRASKRIAEINDELAERSAAKKATRAGHKPIGLWHKVLAVLS
jgi:hypothetical protein